ncbi:MAG: hypothetical protein R3Y24_05365 [Eubacteriales bacterium]
MFRKNGNKSLYNEVTDCRQIVYDFRRRNHEMFENYRAVRYKKKPEYNLEKLKETDIEILEKLIQTNAVDAGNRNCFVERILGTVRDEICYLEDQSLDHADFYERQEGNMVIHSADIGKILEILKEKELNIAQEHEHTQELWDKYCGQNQKGVTKYEK